MSDKRAARRESPSCGHSGLGWRMSASRPHIGHSVPDPAIVKADLFRVLSKDWRAPITCGTLLSGAVGHGRIELRHGFEIGGCERFFIENIVEVKIG